MSNKETRISQLDSSELRYNDENGKMIIEGYAAIYDSPTLIGDSTFGYTEKISRGAFDNADMSDVVLRYNHSEGFAVLARTRNKSLVLIPDDKGLFIRAELLDTTDGRDMYKRVQAGLIDKMSFAFTVREEDWDQKARSRDILKFERIFDTALVDFAAYNDTEVYARSLERAKQFITPDKPKLSKDIQQLIWMYK